MKKALKAFLYIVLSLVVLFLAAAIAIPILYKDKMLQVVKQEMNNNLDAEADFKEISLSLFRHFPNLSVRIHDLRIVGKEEFRRDTLVAANQVDLAFNLKKALKGQYDILRIDLIQPRIHAIVHKNGKANWNITKANPNDTTQAKTTKFALKLREYEIHDAYVSYKDETAKQELDIEGLTHKGSGNFNQENFKLKTHTSAKSITYYSGKVPYCSHLKLDLDFDFNVNTHTGKLTFDSREVQLNGLKFALNGFVQPGKNNSMSMDIDFKAPGNDFKNFLSLVPGAYRDNFKDLTTTGKADLDGTVKGVFDGSHMPAFNINVAVNKASVQYPALPQKLSNIAFKLHAANPDGVPDHTIITLDDGHIDFGPEPFDFHWQLKTPMSGKQVDAVLKGRIDLAQLNQFVRLDESMHLSGIINTDLAFKGSLADAMNQQYDSLDAHGSIVLDHIVLKNKDLPDTAYLNSLRLDFTPEQVTVSNLEASFLKTHFTGSGTVNNLLGYYMHKGTLTGSITINADKINGNSWQKHFTTPKTKGAAAKVDTAKTQPFEAPAHLNLLLNGSVDEIEYDRVKIKNVQGAMILGDEVITLKDIQAHALEGEVSINGHYSTQVSKADPDMDFEYIVSLGRLVVLHRHIDHM